MARRTDSEGCTPPRPVDNLPRKRRREGTVDYGSCKPKSSLPPSSGFGWCIEGDSLDDFRRTVELSHVFWGGRFNPIIPCRDQELSKALITSFNVDALYNVSGSASGENLHPRFSAYPMA